MFKLFGSKKNEDTEKEDILIKHDWSFLVADMHSHFIPAIDDGAQTIDDSVALIEKMIELGYKKIVTTPHINYDHYPNNNTKIAKGFEQVKQALKAKDINIPFKAAAEYYVDDHFVHLLDNLEQEPLLTINKNHVLIEFSLVMEPIRLSELLFRMQILGYKPVIAHPERYPYYLSKPSMFEEFKDRGCLLQLNALSLLGYYGSDVKEMAELLLDKKLYDYFGSDMHHIKHAENMSKLTQSKIFPSLYKYPFLNSSITFE